MLLGFDFVLCVLFVLCCVIVGLFIELSVWFADLVGCLVILVWLDWDCVGVRVDELVWLFGLPVWVRLDLLVGMFASLRFCFAV